MFERVLNTSVFCGIDAMKISHNIQENIYGVLRDLVLFVQI